MWTDNVHLVLETIQLYEFFDTGFGDRYVLTPFVINYLQHSITAEDKFKFIEKICAYYADLLKSLYSFISLEPNTAGLDENGSEMKRQNSNQVKSTTLIKRRATGDGAIKSKTFGL
jgi:hypothetical protein